MYGGAGRSQRNMAPQSPRYRNPSHVPMHQHQALVSAA
jgi:hypothetical protein